MQQRSFGEYERKRNQRNKQTMSWLTNKGLDVTGRKKYIIALGQSCLFFFSCKVHFKSIYLEV